MLTLFALLVSAAYGRGIFYPMEETVDRVRDDGVAERSYIVVFNENAPFIGQNMEKLASWLAGTIPEVRADNLQHIYACGGGFRGYALWATRDVVDKILDDSTTKYVEENSVVRAYAPFTARPDWGQVRSNQPGARNLQTTPANLYNTSYPAAGNATDGTGGWDFIASVYTGWNGRINNGARAKVWVVDTGVLTNHQEFGGRVSPAVDCVNQASACNGGSPQDCNGHGTHCAGSVGGQYRGVATGAQLASVRVLNCQGSGTNANVILGFNHVSNNQLINANTMGNIMSVSLGGGASTASDDAIRSGVRNGVIAVVAAGNDNANACNYSPARASTGTDGGITVMASGRLDDRASFTNTGSCGTVFAPGVSVHSAYYTSSTAYSTLSGTSMATPLTAGSIALYVSTQQQRVVGTSGVKDRITATGTNNLVTGTLLAGTPNRIINARWGQ
jgi:subtilisin family serine protease